jgi:hypothetical protein
MSGHETLLSKLRSWLAPPRIHSIESPQSRSIFVVLGLITAVLVAIGEQYYLYLATMVTIYAIVAVSLDFFSGYVSIAEAYAPIPMIPA